MAKESVQQTIGVSLAVCAVCSILVSVTAVGLKPLQDYNKEFDRKKNVLVAAGLIETGESPSSDETEALFKKIEGLVIDLDTGEVLPEEKPGDFDWKKQASDPATSETIPESQDIAKIKRRSELRPVYLYREDGRLKRVILPIYGKGLWSTIYGFLALEGDLNTVGAITFYEHAETPGLGGEIDNPKWKAQWDGKLAFDGGEPAIKVIKGKVSDSAPEAEHKIDGLSGATLTGRGVTNLVRFWLGEEGYGPYLEKLRESEQGETGA